MTDDRTLPVADTVADVDVDTASATSRTDRISASSLDGYILADLIGKGGMGEVVAAHDQRLEREVAIKRMRDAHPTPDAVARFLREAKIQARLDHPAIVPVHALGSDPDGRPYFTMKRLAGTTLADKLAQRGKLQPLLRAFVDVCLAIELAHTRGIVHRDLKPSNIMLGDYGEVYVLDWGIARVIGTERTSALHLPLDSLPPANETATGALLGTPGYMAPEQMRGQEVAAGADVYALGAILFEILAGESLHPAGNAAFASTLAEEPASPAARRPERAIAPELDRACTLALAPDPAARPSARALAERIQLFLDGDRDHEYRLRLVAEHVAAARAALAAGDRVEAMRRGGNALAIDPTCAEAAELVTALIIHPPAVLPAEIEAELETEELKLDTLRARQGALAYLMVWLFVPLVPLLHVSSWPALVAMLAVTTAMSMIALVQARKQLPVPIWLVLAGNLAVVVAFSRVAGPFVLSPLMACGVAVAVGAQRELADRAWITIAWLGSAILLPIVLELVGVLETTWQLAPQGLISHGTMFDGRNATDAVGITIGTIALAIVVGVYTLQMTKARRIAQRASHVQAWHLRQLLPKR